VGDDAEPAGARRAGRIGRRVALAVYWTLLLYLAVVGFYSVTPQVFAPDIDEDARTELPEACDPALRLLHEQLREHAARTMHRGHDERDFWRRWDARYDALSVDCHGEPTYGDVGQLRHRLQTTLQRFQREDGALSREVERLLAATGPRSEDD